MGDNTLKYEEVAAELSCAVAGFQRGVKGKD
jgi:hypothetical protein